MQHTSPFKGLWELLHKDKKDVISIYFYSILNGLTQLSVPIGMQAIIGFVMGAAMVTSIYVLIFLVVSGVFIVGFLQINQMKIIEKIQQKIYTRYAFEFVDKISKFDLYKTNTYYLPEKANRFIDTLNVQKGFSKLLLDIPTALIQIFFGLILLSLYHPLFIIFSFIFALILWLILLYTSKKGLETNLQESNFKYETISWLQEIARIKSFKYTQDSGLDFKKLDTIVINYLSSRTRHFEILLFQYKSLIAFKVLITIILLGGGVYLLINQKINIGEFVAAEIIILTILAATEKIIKNLEIVYDVVTGLEKLSSFTDLDSEKSGNINAKSASIGLELIDFNFSYPKGRNLFNNIHLNVPAHSIVCISGDENSGKSTLLKVLSGLYTHYSGTYLINTIPIYNYNLINLRKRMGVLLNTDEVFSGTIYENISMGRDNISPENILDISEKLGFHNLLQNLSHGFSTEIEIMGRNLTTSMISKIMLLRTFCHEPNLIILEEPWRNLEEEYQKNIKKYLLSKPFGATIIVVSNDTVFASKCDYSYILENGNLKAL